ncbi:hypothetical protein [Flavilitoribacter nigricans]|uniref:Uncharacterized protein n=1 Tax=Flavilitoribacter nigricans (strain ATCC 23147 / DSM 23189 / NBRC 102662 / NCIMB 1420 / SS-2) TaxID=1122177 RepID=A0A2D0N9X7_FLAN2|nr:hypothetical protein [Flavilitoribacter nigricans]PHN05170.1 hypothetical protein CRP01_16760 [Flavilitoribacter nigricans DSM 23189 = NBRC 102662]
MWFEQLTGFPESSPEQVRENLEVKDGILRSRVNGKTYRCGNLEIPALAELRAKRERSPEGTSSITLSEVVGNVQELHQLPENAGALFQAASQFNLLEMVSPEVTPERGVGIYEFDRTQGPACAIACGAGTIYRNYFVPLNGRTGQTADNQVDCLEDIGKALGNEEDQLWQMKNGYALPSREGLRAIDEQLAKLTEAEFEELKGKLRIGWQRQTEVTLGPTRQLVSQAYCSALPIGYSQNDDFLWARFARLVLEATYEATLYAGLINRDQTGNERIFLTLVGGGVFRNREEWIHDAILRVIRKFERTGLDIRIVSYGSPDPRVRKLLDRF